MCPLVAGVVVANTYESPLLAVERMLYCEALAAAVTAGGEVRRSGAVPEGDVLKPFVLRELSAREAVRYSGEPGAGGLGSLEAFLHLRRRVSEECLEESVFAVAALFSALSAGGTDGRSVVVGTDWLVAEEGPGEVGGRVV